MSGTCPMPSLCIVWTLKLSNGDRHFLAIGERRSTMAVWRVKSGCPRVILINPPDCLKFMTYAGIGDLQRRGPAGHRERLSGKRPAIMGMSRPPPGTTPDGTRN